MGYGSLDPRDLKKMRARQRLKKQLNVETPKGIYEQKSLSLAVGPVSQERETPFTDVWSDVCTLVTIRGLFVNRMANGSYTLTLKVTLSGGKRGYRFGYLKHPGEVPEVLSHWLEEGYWTPDRQ